MAKHKMSTTNQKEEPVGCPSSAQVEGRGRGVLGLWQSGVSPAVPPTFENPKTEKVSQVAGSPLVLSCDVTGVPAPAVSWLKDRMPVGECIASCQCRIFLSVAP